MGHIALSVWFRADRVYLESNKLTLATPIYGIVTDIWFLTSAECRSCIRSFVLASVSLRKVSTSALLMAAGTVSRVSNSLPPLEWNYY